MTLFAFTDGPEKKAMAEALQQNGLGHIVEIDDSPQLASVDKRMKQALRCLEREGCLKHKYDYIWILRYINEEHLKGLGPSFDSVKSYREYVHDYLDCPTIAGVSTLSQYYSCGCGRFPNWTFSDTKDAAERLRRVNIAARFSSVFVKGR